ETNDMVFCLADVEFSEFLPAWFRQYERFRHVLRMLIDVHYTPLQDPYSMVINAVAAAERTHHLLDLPEFFLTGAQPKQITRRMRTLLEEDGHGSEIVTRIVQQVG